MEGFWSPCMVRGPHFSLTPKLDLKQTNYGPRCAHAHYKMPTTKVPNMLWIKQETSVMIIENMTILVPELFLSGQEHCNGR